jgi:hypothetical protein
MSFPSRRTPVSELGAEDGNILATVMVVAMLVGLLATLALATGRQADTASASDRNHDLALGVAEAGLHQAIAKIDAQTAAGTFVGSFTFSGSTPQGPYDVTVTRTFEGFVIDAQGASGHSQLGRARHIRATLVPPPLFPEGERYALFSYTSIELKNNDEVSGDVWANDSVLVRLDAKVHGDVTAAQSWIQLEGQTLIDGNTWSGGYHPNGWAMDLANLAVIDGAAKASVSAPADPDTCQGEDPNNYMVRLGSGSVIEGDLTSLGSAQGAGEVRGQTYQACTSAAPARPMPVFTFNPNNYDPATYRSFTSVAEFQSWLTDNRENLQGTFSITETSPSQTNRVDLTGVTLAGNTTIVTNAPVYTSGISDGAGDAQGVFIVVSSYRPPESSVCDVNQSSSDCSIHAYNNFNVSCRFAVLIYASNGPAAVKNNQTMCGTIIGDGILVKNNQALNFDARLERVVGFGTNTYEVGTWQELPPT